jgi:hypothetical protein
MGFILGAEGYEFIDGPSGAGGHGVTAAGFDGVAYNPRTGDLILGDNKTFKRVGNVTSATAIDPERNLQQNLRGMISHLQNNPNLRAGTPNRIAVLQRLVAADRALTQWIAAGRPAGQLNLGGVRLMVFNAGGNSTGVGGRLALSGAVGFRDLNAPPRIRVAADAAESVRLRVATETPRVRVAIDEGMHVDAHPPMARSAVIASIASLGAGIALGILQAGMKDAMLNSLEKLQQPRPDPRSAVSYFSDPNTGKSMRFLDLLNKNLKAFGTELENHHVKVMAGSMGEVMLLAASRTRSIPERLEFLSALREELFLYGDQLDIVYDNLDAAQELAPKVQKAAEGAEQLARALPNAALALHMAGFSWEEMKVMVDKLWDFSTVVRKTFKDVDQVHSQVKRIRDELSTLYWQLLKISWGIILDAASDAAKPAPPAKEPISQGSLRVLEAMGPGTPILRLRVIKDLVRHHPGDFIPSVETALRELRDAGLVVLMEGKGGLIIEAWKTRP